MAKALRIVPELSAVEALSDFDGRTVGATSIKVTNAGDGLSEALQVDPTEFHLNETVYVVLETTVAEIEHRPMVKGDDIGPLERAHVLRAGAATIVDKDIVAAQLRVQTERIRKAREAAQGIQAIPAVDGSDPWAGEDGPSPMYDDDPDGPMGGE